MHNNEEKTAVRCEPMRPEYAEQVSQVMRSIGLSCDVQYARETLSQGVCLFEGESLIGFCGIIPCAIWVGSTVKEACQLGMFGMVPGHAPLLFDLLDGVRAGIAGRFCYANTANAKGAKIWTKLFGMKPGPAECATIRYKPIFPFPWPMPADVVDNQFVDDLRISNTGLMTARSVEAWSQLKAHCVTIKEGGRILGAAFVRKRPITRFRLPRYEIVDICAIDNNREVLEKLLRKCQRFVASRGGIMLEYIGSPTGANDLFDEFFARKRPAVSNTFVYCGDEDVSSGWFFGPYDGDRCQP